MLVRRELLDDKNACTKPDGTRIGWSTISMERLEGKVEFVLIAQPCFVEKHYAGLAFLKDYSCLRARMIIELILNSMILTSIDGSQDTNHHVDNLQQLLRFRSKFE